MEKDSLGPFYKIKISFHQKGTFQDHGKIILSIFLDAVHQLTKQAKEYKTKSFVRTRRKYEVKKMAF